MIGALFLRHLKRDARVLAGLTLGLAGMELLLVQVGAGFAGGEAFGQLLNMLPPAFRAFIDSQIPNLASASPATFAGCRRAR